ncbi:MAG: site-2 protease family protein, partial [Candidatus Berkelbacteria bacterium]|nr:site-2 protease family protein [Candidatus Berkelbacteria bacterium]
MIFQLFNSNYSLVASIISLLIYFLMIVISISFHEFAHAYVAYRFGDPTAKYEGRITLNPLAHLDLMGTIFILVVGFGWGKPVMIDPRNFKSKYANIAVS